MLSAPAMANNSFMGQRRRPLMPSFPGSQFRKKNPYFQNVANDPGTAPRAKQVMTLKDRRVLVVYQSDRRARRIILRFDHGHGRIVVVLPKRVSLAQGRRFALLNRGWIRDRLDLLPEPIPFRPGLKIPFMGEMLRIRHRPGAEDCRHDHVADKAGEARDEREPANGGDASDHLVLEARRTTLSCN